MPWESSVIWGPDPPCEGAILGDTTPIVNYRDFLRELCNKSSAVAEMGDRGHNRHAPKEGAALLLSRRGPGSPSNTMWPGPRSTSVPNGVFIHSAV